MPESRVHDPAVAFRFQVIARQGTIEAGFSKVSGLRDESEVIEYREGSDDLVKTKIPGIRTFPALVLERGMMTDAEGLIQWRRDAILCLRDPSGQGAFRSDTKISVHNCDGASARVAIFQNAWPNALQLSDLDAGSSEVNIESVELAHEGRVRDTIFARGGAETLKQTRSGR